MNIQEIQKQFPEAMIRKGDIYKTIEIRCNEGSVNSCYICIDDSTANDAYLIDNRDRFLTNLKGVKSIDDIKKLKSLIDGTEYGS